MNKTEQLLNQAVEQSTPNLLDMILSTEVTPMKEPDFIIRQEEPQKTHPFLETLLDGYSRIALRPVLSFALCLILVVTLSSSIFINTTYVKADTLVSIDVNPSIELTTNQKNQVIKVSARNSDAKIILDGMDLIRVDLNIAVNAIIGSMLKHGYLQDDNNIILVSVSNKKKEKAKQIQNDIEEDFSTSLKVVNKQATVIKQDIKKDSSLEETAARYNISIGKLQLINQILELDDSLDMEVLSEMNMKELAALAYEYGILLDGYTPDEENSDDLVSPENSTEELDDDTNDYKSNSNSASPSSDTDWEDEVDNDRENSSDDEEEDNIDDEEEPDEDWDVPSKVTVPDSTTDASPSSDLPGKLNGNETDIPSEE